MTGWDVITEAEAAELMRVKPTTVRALGRRGLIRRIPPTRPPRYDRGSVESYLDRGVYDDRDVEPDRTPSTEAPPPRRGNGCAPQGSLAVEAVGSGGPLHRRIGPQAADVAIRRVPR